MTEDTILLERYVTDGDRAALEELFVRHYAAVHRTILHMVHNSFDADDLAQATFLLAVRKGDQFRSRGSFRGWLLTIAVNQVRDFRRGKKQKREDQLFDLFQATGVDADVPETGMRREFEQKLEQALESLPPNLKDPLVLHYYEGLSFAEVAQTLELPKSTVQSRIASSIARLREEFTQRGWVVMLPTFDRLLPVPPGAPTAMHALPSARRALLVLAAASITLVAAVATMWGEWSGAKEPERRAVEQAGAAQAEGSSKAAAGSKEASVERVTVDVAERRVMVRGRVVASGTGEPLVGATVRLFDYVEQREEVMTTDGEGLYAFPSTVGRSDAFAVVAAIEGRAREVLPSVLAGREFEQVRLPVEQFVRGRVLGADGKPVTRCRVRAIRSPGEGILAMLLGAVPQRLRVESECEVDNAAGAFALGGLSGNKVMVVVDIAGEQPWHVTEEGAIVPGGNEELIVRLPESASVRVHLVDKLSGDPMDGATIEMRFASGSWLHRFPVPHEATTEPGVYTMRAWMTQRVVSRRADGSRVRSVRPGMSNVVVYAPGYAPCGDAANTSLDGLSVDFELQRGGAVLGRARDEQGRAMAGMRILPMVEEKARELIVSDADGAFTIAGLPTDYDVTLASYLPDHSRRFSLAQVTAREGQQQQLQVGGAAGGGIAGSLMLHGEPVVAATVQVLDGDGVWVDTSTDHAGRFRVDGLSPGSYTVRMWGDEESGMGAKDVRVLRPVQLQPGATARVDVDLRGEVRGICVDAATGKAAAGCHVELARIGIEGAAIAYHYTRADGRFRLMVEGDGAYELRAQTGRQWYSRRNPTLRITAGKPVTGMRLEVERDPENATAPMRVLDAESGKPLAVGTYKMKGANVQGNGRWMADGIVNFENLRGGRFEVQVHSDAYVDQTLSFDVLPGQRREVRDVLMQRATSVHFVWPPENVEPHVSGLVDGDRLLAWGTHQLETFADVLQAREQLRNAEAPMRILRGDMELTLTIGARRIPELALCFGWMHNFDIPIVNR